MGNRNGEDLSLWSADDMEKPSELANTQESQISTSTSSTTLTSTTFPTKDPLTPIRIASGAFSSSLILDGARAIDAICRPYAIALVGKPDRSDFDFYTSIWKLSVKVSSDDKVPEGVATELYLPFIHYASELGESTSNSTTFNRSSNSSRVSLVIQNAKEKIGSSSVSEGTPSSPTEPMRLVVDIKVSTGRTEMDGQTLKWFYSPPVRGEAIYTIEVKRSGGAIPRSMGYGGGSGSWADVCPSSCCIA